MPPTRRDEAREAFPAVAGSNVPAPDVSTSEWIEFGADERRRARAWGNQVTNPKPVVGRRSECVALVSGGLDSIVSLARADRETGVRLVLFVDYSQRAVDAERASAMSAANYYGLPYQEVSLPWLGELAPEGMRSSPGRSDSGSDESEGDAEFERLDDVWIPNRNGVFLNVAACYAERLGCGLVVAGFNREEAAEFPDNSEAFVRATNKALEFSTRRRVRVACYTQDLDKPGIIAEGLELGAPLSVVWSCYRSGETMCGACPSCRRLRAAIKSLDADRRPRIEFAGE